MAQLALAILVLAVLVTFAVLARRAGQKRASWAFVALAVLISAAFSYVGWRTSRAPPQLDLTVGHWLLHTTNLAIRSYSPTSTISRCTNSPGRTPSVPSDWIQVTPSTSIA